jgi:hypothetical protein
MIWRVVVVVILCLPAWAIYGFAGPIGWLEAERGVGLTLAAYLAFAAFYGIFISLVTTPLAILMSTIFLIWEAVVLCRRGKGGDWGVAFSLTARFLCLAIIYIALPAAAVGGMYIGSHWMGVGMKF